MKTGNIGIRNIGDIGIADIDVYGTDLNKQVLFKVGTKVNFYRSVAQSEGKLGKADTSYKGEFGFDLYNKEHSPKGSVIYYLDENGRNIKNKEYDDYISSYLSIWPPNVDKEKSSLILYVKANDNSQIPDSIEYECQEWNESNKTFNKASTKLKITKLNAENVKGINYNKINIQCIDAFKNDHSVVAKINNTIAGRIVVKANAKIYETTIQPVLIYLDSESSPKVEKKEISELNFISKLSNYFNNNSFNQTYLKGKLADKLHVVRFLEKDLTTNLEEPDNPIVKKRGKDLYVNYFERNQKNARLYNNYIEQRYSALFYNVSEIQKNIENMQKCIKEILDIFKEDFSYSKESNLKKAKKFHEDHVATKTWDKVLATNFYSQYLDYKAEYLKSKLVHLDQDKKVYVFINMSIEGGKNPDSKTQAYSVRGSGVTHIFKSAVNDPDGLALVTHEIGHSFSLYHTFEDEAKEEIKDLNAVIDQKKAELSSLTNLKTDLRNYYPLDNKYRVIQGVLERHKTSPVDINLFEKNFLLNIVGNYSYLDEDSKLRTDKKTSVIEIESRPLPEFDIQKTKTDVQKIISDNQEKIKTWEPYIDIIREQSETLENIMDYRQYSTPQSDSGEDGKSNFNANFKYNSFYQWQWKKMIEQSIANNYISEINPSI